MKEFKSYNALIFLSMLYVTVGLISATLTHRLIYIDHRFITQGGTLLAPFWFILGDIIAELYGYKCCRRVIIFTFICQTIFAISCQLIITMSAPPNWSHISEFNFVLGSLIRTDISSFLAFFIGTFLNAYLITKWKFMLKGRFFWLRSLGASTISEALFTFLAVLFIQYGVLPNTMIFHIMVVSYSIKVFYSLIFVWPANLVVNYVKYKEKIDVYDYRAGLNPLSLKI